MGVTIAAEDHGVAHCFRCGYVESRHNPRELTALERKAFARRMSALRRQHDLEQQERQAQASASANIRWAAAFPCDKEHAYLTAKQVRAHGVRIEAHQTLLIPLRDTTGHLHCLQTITPDGEKRFTPGGRVKGCYHAIGRPNGRLVICEGYATGATIHESTGHAVAVAFNSGNLLPVAQALRSKFPLLTLVIGADDDYLTEGNPGLTAATNAAKAVNGLLAVPNFRDYPRGQRDTDFNDLQRLARAMEVVH